MPNRIKYSIHYFLPSMKSIYFLNLRNIIIFIYVLLFGQFIPSIQFHLAIAQQEYL